MGQGADRAEERDDAGLVVLRILNQHPGYSPKTATDHARCSGKIGDSQIL